MTPCAYSECDTILSTYNPSPMCHAHTERAWTPLLRHMAGREWHTQAACRRLGSANPNPFDAEIWSRDRGYPLGSHQIRVAKAVCATCPVRRECLSAELAHQGDREPGQGIWGGTLPQERKVDRGLSLAANVDILLDRMNSQARIHGLIGKERVA